MANNIKSPKKLIEVALPLDDINKESAKEKNNPFIPHHPRSIHTWWARRPFTAARALLFAQLVNDPGGERGYRAGLTKEQAAAKREVLFDIIRDLVKWENTNNEEVLERARAAIRQSWRETCELNKGKSGFNPEVLPAFHDPFAGGGAIPLEAQRLGLESYASDLNPVAVMINKAMIEIPPRFANSIPIGPIPEGEAPQLFQREWHGADGLAEDVRRYGYWMRAEAQKRLKEFYPKVKITEEMARTRDDLKSFIGKELTVIAWLWARTVKSQNPAYNHIDVPLVSNYVLSSKPGKEVYIQPIVTGNSYTFEVKIGIPPQNAVHGSKAGAKSADFLCIMSGMPIDGKYIKAEGKAGRLGYKLLAVVCESPKGRIYISPTTEMEKTAIITQKLWKPSGNIPTKLSGGTCVPYGLDTWDKLFTNRQLLALNTFADLVSEVKNKVINDAMKHGMQEDNISLEANGQGATAYGEAIATYLGLAISRWADFSNALCSWNAINENLRILFARQAIPMAWDYAEINPIGNVGTCENCIESIYESFINLAPNIVGHASQENAVTQTISHNKIISTDPPYYDNIFYADLSDFFYVWHRRILKGIFPSVYSTMITPKEEELVATPHRHGGKENASKFFLNGMKEAMACLANHANSAFPVTIYYAFKSSDTDEKGTSNTGWETFLSAVLQAGFYITGTWPIRTEKKGRAIGNGTNALASSIVLVCRRRPDDADEIDRRDFLNELRESMPNALRDMMGKDGVSSPIAPVDLAQAAIGPGMEIFSKYKAVLNADGTSMTVHEAMIEINKQITDYLNPEGTGFDAATLFCNEWFQENNWGENAYGLADVLARAKGTSVERVKLSGVILAEGGKVQLLNWHDYPEDYDPSKDKNRPTWEALHHLIRVLNTTGENEAGKLLAKMPESSEDIRQLAYFLYTMCERKGNADDARYYNELMTSWHAIVAASMEYQKPKQEQMELF